jgi:hypothetical protein
MLVAISALESVQYHRHLFVFEPAGDAHNDDYDVGVLCGGSGLRRSRFIRFRPDELQSRCATHVAVIKAQRSPLALNQMNAARGLVDSVVGEQHRNLHVVDRQSSETDAA